MMIVIRKKPDISTEDFRQFMRYEYGRTYVGLPETRSCVQYYLSDVMDDGAEPTIDAIVQISFDPFAVLARGVSFRSGVTNSDHRVGATVGVRVWAGGDTNWLAAPQVTQSFTVAPPTLAGGAHLAATPDGTGYWVVGPTGSLAAYGTATNLGSMAGRTLNAPIVGIASTSDGKGYWLVASDGGVFAFGDAAFAGSMGGKPLNQPVADMTADPAGGYWLVAIDGGVFSFGGATFFGSTGAIHLNQPVVGITPTSTGQGYWLVASDGGVFNDGNAGFFGSLGGSTPPHRVVGLFSTKGGGGYTLVDRDGTPTSF